MSLIPDFCTEDFLSTPSWVLLNIRYIFQLGDSPHGGEWFHATMATGFVWLSVKHPQFINIVILSLLLQGQSRGGDIQLVDTLTVHELV